MRVFLLALLLLLAGCTDSISGPADGPGEAPRSGPETTPSRPGAFGPPAVVTGAAPLVNTGEPVAAWGPDGAVYVTFTGCDRMPAGVGHESVDGAGCYHSPLYRDDGDGVWDPLLQDGRLHADAPFSSGDTVVRVGSGGTVYVLYMDPDGITLLRSSDRGETWELMPRPHEGTRDRPWMAVAGDEELHLLYRVGATIYATMSPDGGQTWEERTKLTDTHVRLSEIRHREGCGSYMAFAKSHQTTRAPDVPATDDAFSLHLAHRPTGGNWSVAPVLGDTRSSIVGFHDGEPMGFIALDIGPDCAPHLAWSQETDPDGPTEGGVVVHAVNRSGWSFDPVPLGDDVVMPWMRVGQELYILAYARDRIGGADGPWDVRLARGPDWTVQVVDPAVHVGEFCTSNPKCVPTDRSLLDHLYLDLHADHGLVAAYGAEPAAPDVKQMRIAVALGG